MAPHTSTDMRYRMVHWHDNLGKSSPEIAELAGCSERTVREVLRLHREFGDVRNPFVAPRGRQRSMNTTDLDYICSLLDANPALYLDELKDQLSLYRDLDVSLATLSRALRWLAITRKRISKAALERNELLRATWQAEYGDIPAEFCIWLDESSVDDRTNQRRNGWSAMGQACVRRELFIRGTRYSVLPALTCQGYIALEIFEGSVTKDRFLAFLEQDLVSVFLLSLSPPISDICIDSGTPAITVSGSQKCRYP